MRYESITTFEETPRIIKPLFGNIIRRAFQLVKESAGDIYTVSYEHGNSLHEAIQSIDSILTNSEGAIKWRHVLIGVNKHFHTLLQIPESVVQKSGADQSSGNYYIVYYDDERALVSHSCYIYVLYVDISQKTITNMTGEAFIDLKIPRGNYTISSEPSDILSYIIPRISRTELFYWHSVDSFTMRELKMLHDIEKRYILYWISILQQTTVHIFELLGITFVELYNDIPARESLFIEWLDSQSYTERLPDELKEVFKKFLTTINKIKRYSTMYSIKAEMIPNLSYDQTEIEIFQEEMNNQLDRLQNVMERNPELQKQITTKAGDTEITTSQVVAIGCSLMWDLRAVLKQELLYELSTLQD